MESSPSPDESLRVPRPVTLGATARRLSAAGGLLIGLGVLGLVLANGLLDSSLDRANERSARPEAAVATLSPGETADVTLAADRRFEAVAQLDRVLLDEQGADEAPVPTVRLTDPSGTPVPNTRTDPFPVGEFPVDELSIGTFRTAEAGTYRVQISVAGDTVAGVSLRPSSVAALGDVGGAAGSLAATALAGTVVGLGTLLVVVGVGAWMWAKAGRRRTA
jgi:hypothetical protein